MSKADGQQSFFPFEASAGHAASFDESVWPKVEDLASRSSMLLVKKLSRNDTSWADDSRKHQAGFYIPRSIRESDFFPRLIADNPDKPHIFHAQCPSLWPQTGETKVSGMRHYSNKGPETHFTVIPHDLFSGLSPASLLLGGKLTAPVGDVWHWFVVIDSNSEDAEILETALDLDSQFHCGLFKPEALKSASTIAADEVGQLIEQLNHALRDGKLDAFMASVAKLPSPQEIAEAAQAAYLSETGLVSLDPYSMANPGDAIMRISRDIEYTIFKRHELRRRASEVVRILVGTSSDTVTAVVKGFPALDAVFLSASQQRKTRAGRSFENHIARTLRDGRIRHQEQAILGGRRPDFVLPDVHTLKLCDARPFEDALVLSAKTTLRERWKQVTRERFNSAIFLATIDDRVPEQAIGEMRADGITLVVPESLKASKETCYRENSNVISFRSFFDAELKSKRPKLIAI